MAEKDSSSGGGGGCCLGSSCGSTILTILLLWALFGSLPTPWGKLSIDIFPPAIRLQP